MSKSVKFAGRPQSRNRTLDGPRIVRRDRDHLPLLLTALSPVCQQVPGQTNVRFDGCSHDAVRPQIDGEHAGRRDRILGRRLQLLQRSDDITTVHARPNDPLLTPKTAVFRVGGPFTIQLISVPLGVET